MILGNKYNQPEADSKWPGDTPKLIQAAITVPAIVEKPLVKTTCNSDKVKLAKYGWKEKDYVNCHVQINRF